MDIIGRKQEIQELRKYYDSGRPELVVVYGRRRVGKTFLIKEYFENNFSFYFTGQINSSSAVNLENFDKAILEYGGKPGAPSKNWGDAFFKLKRLLLSRDQKRKVVFIDEMPWLDTSKSGFLPAFDYFWNSYAGSAPEILFICCGSATSWITKKLFQNRGGLHNRITGRIHLAPFSLEEGEAFLKSRGIEMTRFQITESYMIFGGIPFYLNLFDKELSFPQNVDRLCFAEKAPLRNEYEELYKSLFGNQCKHMKIIEALSKRKEGMTRNEISKAVKISPNGHLSEMLNELLQCDFVERYADFTKPKNDSYYYLKDSFSLFYLRYMGNNNSKDEYFWTNYIEDGGHRAWCGNSFELVCKAHIRQIKKKLGILGVSTNTMSWRSKSAEPGVQIDLLISRRDGVINLCEIKYLKHPFEISKEEAAGLERKRAAFIMETGTKSAIHSTMVTTYGVAKKGYFSIVQSEITMNDLFAPE